jgi:hypothetical protein
MGDDGLPIPIEIPWRVAATTQLKGGPRRDTTTGGMYLFAPTLKQFADVAKPLSATP